MKLQYENNLEDLIAFNRHHAANSPSIRRRVTIVRWIVPAIYVFIVVSCTLPFIGENDWDALGALSFFYVPLLIISLLWFLLLPRFNSWSMDRNIRRLYLEGGNKGVLGSHELELTDEKLIDRTAFGEAFTRLEAIERVVDTGQYKFIYLSSLSAHVIPADRVWEGDLSQFINTLEKQIARVRNTPDVSIMRKTDFRP